MNSNMILEFLKAYKNLDELCRQILSSDRGVSEYIDEMSNESQGYRVAGWEGDYKKLKKTGKVSRGIFLTNEAPKSRNKDLPGIVLAGVILIGIIVFSLILANCIIFCYNIYLT